MKEKFTMDKYADLLEKDIKQATLYKDKFVPDMYGSLHGLFFAV